MSRWMKIAVVTVLLVGLVGGGIAVAGAPGRAAQIQRARQAAPAMIKRLGITAEQAAQIRNILTGDRTENERLQKALRVAKLNLALAIEEDAPAEKLTPMVNEYQKAAGQAAGMRADRVTRAFAVLNPVQQARVIVTGRADWWKLFVLPQKQGK